MRKSMQVFNSVKNTVQDLKKELELSNESEVIEYLHQFYLKRKESLTLNEHREIKETIAKNLNQSNL